jgi:hypothetical protein
MAEARMQANLMVMLRQVSMTTLAWTRERNPSGFAQGRPSEARAPVAELALEAFGDAILPAFPGIDRRWPELVGRQSREGKANKVPDRGPRRAKCHCGGIGVVDRAIFIKS